MITLCRHALPALVLLASPAAIVAQSAPVDTVWPAAPEPARIRYLGAVRSEADLGRRESFMARVTRRLTGRSAPNLIHIERPFDVLATRDRLYVTNGTLRAVVLLDQGRRSGRLLGADVPGGFSRPMGLGGDRTGRIYVADPGARRVVVLRPDGSFERAFGGPSVLLNPVDVAVDATAGRVYVVDSYLHQIVVFDSTGAVAGRIGRQAGAIGQRGRPDAAPASPVSGTHGDETAPSADRSSAHGEPHDVWENRGGEAGEFRYPISAAVGPDGALYVSDQMNFRVQVFDRSGAFVREFGRLGDYPGSFTRPKGIAVDSDGHVYVADASFNNVQVFDAQGRLLIAFGALGHAAGQLWMPLGIAIDEHDRIAVADRYNNRAQLYQYLAPASDPIVVEAARVEP